MDNSGFGINPVTLGPSAPADVWERYIEAHPGAAIFQNKPLLFYDDLISIFTGKVATGKYAISSVTPTGGTEKKRNREQLSDEEDSVDDGKNIEDMSGTEGCEDIVQRDANRGKRSETIRQGS